MSVSLSSSKKRLTYKFCGSSWVGRKEGQGEEEVEGERKRQRIAR